MTPVRMPIGPGSVGAADADHALGQSTGASPDNEPRRAQRRGIDVPGLAASLGAALSTGGLARRELRDLFGKLGRVDAGIGLGLLDRPRCTS
jgi:hypothetical protein